MLVGFGTDALYRLWRERVHFHAHRQAEGVEHFHARSHRGESAPHDTARHEHRHLPGVPGRALLVGMVHGMAGSAALILLSLEAFRSPAWGIVYIAIFGLGSILGMAALSAAIAVPLRLTSRSLTRVHGGFSATIGLATVVIGCYIVIGTVPGFAG
jgi:ABC-type nickel/cobalt efflux system permease component RcnA